MWTFLILLKLDTERHAKKVVSMSRALMQSETIKHLTSMWRAQNLQHWFCWTQTPIKRKSWYTACTIFLNDMIKLKKNPSVPPEPLRRLRITLVFFLAPDECSVLAGENTPNKLGAPHFPRTRKNNKNNDNKNKKTSMKFWKLCLVNWIQQLVWKVQEKQIWRHLKASDDYTDISARCIMFSFKHPVWRKTVVMLPSLFLNYL